MTLKLGANIPSHYFLTHSFNVPIIIWVLVLLCQFVPCVIKYKIIACDHLLRIVLISFRQSISRYTPVFPNCSIFLSFGSYLGILYCFPNVCGCFYFILLGPPICPIGFTSLACQHSRRRLYSTLGLILVPHTRIGGWRNKLCPRLSH